MHELSLARSVVEIAEKEVRKAKAQSVKSISLRIGECAGVELAAFEFAWPFVVQNTVLEAAEKEIKKIEGKAACVECGLDFTLHQLFDCCPGCGSYVKDIYEGREFTIESITVN